MKKFFRLALVLMTALAVFMPMGKPAKAVVTIIKFTGTQQCMVEVDPTGYITFLPSGNFLIRDLPVRCINEVYDASGNLVVPISIDHIAYFNANFRPFYTEYPYDWDGIGPTWGDCPGSGWKAHFEGYTSSTGSTGKIGGTGEKGGPYEGMVFAMETESVTGGITYLTGWLMIPND